MKKITFTEIGMENYGPYVEPFILECPEDSLTLITGPNGVGKTISLDSLSFTFYGITSKGERGDDVVNNEVGKNCHTWVKFQDDENNTYLVDRYHKHSKFKNTARITRNGEDKPYKVGHREVIAEVERLICDRKTFTNALMFGQKVKDFFTDLPDTEQKSIFWKLLDLLKYSFYRKTAKTKIDTIESTITEVRNKIAVATGMVEQIEEQIDEEGKKAVKYEADKLTVIGQYEQSIVDAQEVLKMAQDQLKQLPEIDAKAAHAKAFEIKAKLDNLGRDAEDIKKDVETEAYKKVNELTATRNAKQQEITKKYQKLYEVITQKSTKSSDDFQLQIDECNDAIADLSSKIAVAEASTTANLDRIKELESSHLKVGSECPTCLEAITKDSIKNIKCIIGEFKVKNKDLKLTITAAKVAKGKRTEKKTEIGQERSQASTDFAQEHLKLKGEENTEIAEIDKRLTEVKQQIADLANNTLKERIADLEVKAQKLQSDYDKASADNAEAELNEKARQELEQKISMNQATVKTFEDHIKSTKDKEFDKSGLEKLVNNKHKQLETLQRANAKIEKIDAEIVRLKFWEEAYSQRGIPSMLIDQAIPLMNASMRKYLDLLSNGRYIVTFDTISQTKGGEYRDKFSVNVLDTKTQINNRKQLSGGQTRLIDIATILTLRDLKKELGGVDFNLFAFDEIFDALDDLNIGYVCNILNSLKEDRSLLVVSHRHQDDLEADNHIQLT